MDSLLKVLGLDEPPMGVFYTEVEPKEGVSPKAQTPVSREAEEKGEVDWLAVRENFSCVLGKVWQARKKKIPAYFDRERFGCLGGAFYLGFLKPYLNMHPFFISTGIEGMFEGEHYAASPEAARAFFEAMDPIPAPKRFCPTSLARTRPRPAIGREADCGRSITRFQNRHLCYTVRASCTLPCRREGSHGNSFQCFISHRGQFGEIPRAAWSIALSASRRDCGDEPCPEPDLHARSRVVCGRARGDHESGLLRGPGSRR